MNYGDILNSFNPRERLVYCKYKDTHRIVSRKSGAIAFRLPEYFFSTKDFRMVESSFLAKQVEKFLSLKPKLLVFKGNYPWGSVLCKQVFYNQRRIIVFESVDGSLKLYADEKLFDHLGGCQFWGTTEDGPILAFSKGNVDGEPDAFISPLRLNPQIKGVDHVSRKPVMYKAVTFNCNGLVLNWEESQLCTRL